MYTVGYHTCTLHVYLTSTAAHGGRSVGRYVCKYRIMCDVPCKYLQLAECKRQAIHSCQSWPGRQRWKSNLFPADGWSVTGVRTCSKFKGKSRKEKGKGKKRKKEKGKKKTPLIPHRQCNVIHVKVQTFFCFWHPRWYWNIPGWDNSIQFTHATLFSTILVVTETLACYVVIQKRSW